MEWEAVEQVLDMSNEEWEARFDDIDGAQVGQEHQDNEHKEQEDNNEDEEDNDEQQQDNEQEDIDDEQED